MLSGRGNSRTMGTSAAHAGRPMWRAKLTPSALIGSWARTKTWRTVAYSSNECHNARQFDAVSALGGVTFFAIMGLSAYGEWLAASWLIRTLAG